MDNFEAGNDNGVKESYSLEEIPHCVFFCVHAILGSINGWFMEYEGKWYGDNGTNPLREFEEQARKVYKRLNG